MVSRNRVRTFEPSPLLRLPLLPPLLTQNISSPLESRMINDPRLGPGELFLTYLSRNLRGMLTTEYMDGVVTRHEREHWQGGLAPFSRGEI